MVHVETVDLEPYGIIFPSEAVGMVIAQPYLPRISLTAAEPFQFTRQAKPQQLRVLNETLSIARNALHGMPITHFTIFPEYSIPGLEGIALIEDALSSTNWPNGTVVIGGTDGLTKGLYTQLLRQMRTNVDIAQNGIDKINEDQWINCAVIWVKAHNGELTKWVQPKLHPSFDEMDISFQHMFQGNSIYLFKGLRTNGAPYWFGTLVCFDWTATIDTRRPYKCLLADLHNQARQSQLPLSWIFIIQHNKRPSHNIFLVEVRDFFDRTLFPNALRDGTCLIFANTAGKEKPGRAVEFGGSSLVLSDRCGFADQTCVPTFSKGGPRFRDGSTLLSYYRDVFFRERGACIHSFAQINPNSLRAGAATPYFPVRNAYVCPISGVQEPRAPASDVPACVKWLNDELDDLPSLAATYGALPLATQVDASHLANVAALRRLSPQSIDHMMKLAAQQSQAEHADDWNTIETEALGHITHALDIVGIGFTPSAFGGDGAHATVTIGDQEVDILAIKGATHEACIEHSKNFYSILPQRQAILISRDTDNNGWRKKFGSYLDRPNLLGQERDITDPASGALHLGYRDLLDLFQESATIMDIQRGINDQLTA